MYVHPAVYGMPPPPPNVPYQHPSADGFNPVQNQYKSMMEQSVNVVQNTQQDMMSFTSIEQYQARVSLFHYAPCFLPYENPHEIARFIWFPVETGVLIINTSMLLHVISDTCLNEICFLYRLLSLDLILNAIFSISFLNILEKRN